MEMTFIGIDPTACRYAFTYAALDQDARLLALGSGDLDVILTFIKESRAICIAVNAPQHPNIGLVKKELEKNSLSHSHLRGADVRLAEHLLRERGILISPTPSHPETCPEWMQIGFDLYHRLTGMGYRPYPADEVSPQWLETHPHAAFCVLLGQIPLPKPTLEGRIQRQLILYEQNMDIKDPMDVFEEITRHKLLKGILPSELIYTAEELDALVAALTAYMAIDKPDHVVLIGNRNEGQIVLPVSALKASYT